MRWRVDGSPSPSVPRISPYWDGKEYERTSAAFPISGSTTHLGVQVPKIFPQSGSAERGETVTTGAYLRTSDLGNGDGQDQECDETPQNDDQAVKICGNVLPHVGKDKVGQENPAVPNRLGVQFHSL